MLDDPIPALKRRLANEILRLADQTNMHVAARRFGIDVPRMSDLRRGRIARFSVERLIRILATVDRRVDVTVVTTTSASIRWFVGLPKREPSR
jgi:predicted XRE-type DNA-binding protein